MFDPAKETEADWDVDIRDDVILEVSDVIILQKIIFFRFIRRFTEKCWLSEIPQKTRNRDKLKKQVNKM